MRKVVSVWLAITLLIVTASFAGAAYFGMPGTMMNDAHSTVAVAGCAGDNCHGHAAPRGMDADCLDHCLAAASTDVAPIQSDLAAATLLLAIFALVGARLASASAILTSRRRWAEGIGKILLRRKLATVVLRD